MIIYRLNVNWRKFFYVFTSPNLYHLVGVLKSVLTRTYSRLPIILSLHDTQNAAQSFSSHVQIKIITGLILDAIYAKICISFSLFFEARQDTGAKLSTCLHCLNIFIK